MYWEHFYITHQYAYGVHFPLTFLQVTRKSTDTQSVLIIKPEVVGIIASHGIAKVWAV